MFAVPARETLCAREREVAIWLIAVRMAGRTDVVRCLRWPCSGGKREERCDERVAEVLIFFSLGTVSFFPMDAENPVLFILPEENN